MKSKTVPVLFVLAAVLIAGVFFVSRKVLAKEDKSSTRARIVTPKSAVSGSSENETTGTSIESEKYETFVPLYAGETLISTLTIDINNDGYDDEVIIVRKAGSQNLWIIAALIDSESGLYERLEPIETEFLKGIPYLIKPFRQFTKAGNNKQVSGTSHRNINDSLFLLKLLLVFLLY